MSEAAAHRHGPQPPYAADPFPPQVIRVQRLCLVIGVISLGLFFLSFVFPHYHYLFFRGLLFSFVFWLSCTLGPMAFVMISHMTGGGWGVVMRRFAEAASLNLPLMLAVAVVLVFGYYDLFPWARIPIYEHLEKLHPGKYEEVLKVLRHREPLYNTPVFFLRTLLYFGIWAVFMVALRTGSLKMDTVDDPALRRRMRKVCAGGLILFFVTTLLYAMDYILSRETNFYSSIIGFITDIDMGAAGMSLVTLSVCYFASRRPLRTVLTPQHLNDLGNILLALVILWMYTSFAQFLIIWNGNIREDNGYYIYRGLGQQANFWRWVAAALVVGHFFVPFFLLLMKGLKRKTRTLGAICAWLLIMRIVETQWLVGPTGPDRVVPNGPETTISPLPTVFDALAWVGVGGVWVFFYLRTLATQPLLCRNATHQPSEIVPHGAAHAHAL